MNDFRSVERELSRARSARRAVPFAAGSALAAAALVGLVARSLGAALAALGLGLLFALFAGLAAVPRCPACGGSLWRRGERPGSAASPRPTRVERERRCPRCGAGFA